MYLRQRGYVFIVFSPLVIRITQKNNKLLTRFCTKFGGRVHMGPGRNGWSSVAIPIYG